MISLNLAVRLKNAGLRWEPRANDFFAIPDRGLDERIFVINDVMSNLVKINGVPAVTFQGAPEWALDYLVTSEIVWLPSESQIREALTALLVALGVISAPEPLLRLTIQASTQTCTVEIVETRHSFSGTSVAEAYGEAYLYYNKRQDEHPESDRPSNGQL